MKATKNFSLLSFGEEAEGDEEVTEKVVHRYLFIHSNIQTLKRLWAWFQATLHAKVAMPDSENYS